MPARAKFETRTIPKLPKLTGLFYVITACTTKLNPLPLVRHFHLN